MKRIRLEKKEKFTPKYIYLFVVITLLFGFVPDTYVWGLVEYAFYVSFILASTGLAALIVKKILGRRSFFVLLLSALLTILLTWIVSIEPISNAPDFFSNIVVLAILTSLLIFAYYIARAVGIFLKGFIKLQFLPGYLRKNPLSFLNLFAIALLVFFLYRANVRLVNIENERLVNIERRFGGVGKLKCSEEEVQALMNKSVVRIIGSFGEGSGFPINDNEIITSFHVVDGEPSPKIVFPDGSIEIPTEIVGSRLKDIAILRLDRKLTPMSLYRLFIDEDDILTLGTKPSFGEPVYAAGYPLGSFLPGQVSIGKGSYTGERWMKDFNMNTIQTDISLERGMSGGPMVNSCGQVIGVNTLGLAGLSIFVDIKSVQESEAEFTSEEVAKIEIDTETPEGVVQAFYTFIKARDLESAFELVSSERRSTISSFEEWTKGYASTLHVDLVMSKVDEDDENIVIIKIRSQDWIDGEMVSKYFEGEWEVVEENGELKLNDSNVALIEDPDYWWFSYWEKPDWWE